MKKIPYGLASYKRIREEDCYFIDKTAYIPQLEQAGDFLFFIRPRRFGKSSLLSLLDCYYDCHRADEFDFFFKGTYIHDHPTAEKNAHLIMTFDFSKISPIPEMVEQSFEGYCWKVLFFFYDRYKTILGDALPGLLENLPEAYQKLEFTLSYVGSLGHRVYVLIDEYDNFANTILSTYGQTAYQQLTHGGGFFRLFFNVLKGAAGETDTGVARLFITGVSPLTMDDVTSGFNIGKNISLDPALNNLMGFTQQDLQNILNYYQVDTATLLPLLQTWYNNYRFSMKATESVYNTDMVLYFVDRYLQDNHPPDNMLDQNIRIDYGKLRHLMVLDRRLNGNFSRLLEIVQQGQTEINRVADSFPVERLTKPSNFVSLLFYFGLLSYTPEGRLQIPNETVKQLMYSYIRDGYEDVDVFNVDVWHLAGLIRGMAYEGAWQAVFRFLAEEVEKQTAIRDYLLGEKVIQTFLLAYLNVTDYYLTHSEEEMGKGFADLYLEPFLAKHADLQYGYLFELKYISRSEWSEAKLKEQVAEAKSQLAEYVQDDRLTKRSMGYQLIQGVLVFCGWELKFMETI